MLDDWQAKNPEGSRRKMQLAMTVKARQEVWLEQTEGDSSLQEKYETRARLNRPGKEEDM